MNSIHHGWSLDEIAPEARRAAERAAEAAGMPLETWLNQLIKYVSAMELSGKGPARARAIDETIKRAAAEQERIGPVDAPSDNGEEAPMMLETEAPPEQPTTLPAEVLEPNRFAEEQPGERDIEQAIGEWRKTGALKPLVVRSDSRKPGHYEIVSGMERWHAASRLHMRRIPVTVQQLSDEEVLRATLIQKLHQKSLPPLDEAQIYQRLMEETGLSVAALSDVIGRSPTHVATALQLLELPQPVREMINSGELSVLHARTLLGAADPEPAAREVVTRRLDIYQTEQLVRASHGALTPPARKVEESAPLPADIPEAAEATAATEVAEATEIAEAAVAVAEAPVSEMPAELPAEAPAVPAPAETPRMDGTAVFPAPAAPTPDSATAAAAPETPQATEPETVYTAAAEEAAAPVDTVSSEAPLDMGAYITSDTGSATKSAVAENPAPEMPTSEMPAPESTPAENTLAKETTDTAAPILLGGGDRDAGALIEASPAIDNPAGDGPTRETEAEPAGPAASAEPAGPAEPHAPAAQYADTETAGGEHAEAVGGMTQWGPTAPAAEPPEGEAAETGWPASEAAASYAAADSYEAPAPTEATTDSTADSATGSAADSATGAMAPVAPVEAVPPTSEADLGGGEARDETPASEAPADQGDTGRDDSTRMVETHLSTLLGLKVSIAERNRDDGVLSIHYNSESELTDLVSRLNRMPTGRRTE